MKKKFLIIIILLLGALAIYFVFINNSGSQIKRNESETLKRTKKDAGKKVKVNMVEYNEKLDDSKSFKFLVKIKGKNSETYEYNDEQMLSFISSYAVTEDEENLEENSDGINYEKPINIKFEYVNNLAKQFFDKELDKESVSDYIKDGYVNISLPTDVPEDLYKFNELRYNKKDGIYSLFFDKIDPESVNYDTIAKYSMLDYDNLSILANYRLLYKIIDARKVIVGVEQII